MGTKITLPFLIFFFTTVGIAQTRKQIQGKIVVRDATPSNVLILNLNTNEEVRSTKDGFFTIMAKTDDVLVFSSENLDYMRKIVEDSDYENQNLTILMTSKPLVLDEVEIVDNKSYNAVDLGILQKPAKTYTPAERRLKTAGDFKPIHLLGLLGGSLEIDPIINAINGKTKRLKKEILVEQNQLRIKKFQDFFPHEELIQELKMNSEQVNQFTYYIIEKQEFIALLEFREKNKMLFYLIEESFKFKNKTDEKE